MAVNPELLLDLDPRSRRTLARQLETRLRTAIRERRLPAGTKLPSSRALSADLGVSRGVVVAAYAQLLAEGYLEARPGGATRVAAGGVVPPRTAGEAPRWRFRFNFQPYVPDLGAFPRQEWLRSLREGLAAVPDAELGYRWTAGPPRVRSTLVEYLGRVRGTLAGPDEAVISTGSAQSLGLVCGALRRRGARAVAVENPGHRVFREVIRRAGLELVPVDVDECGLRTDELERADVAAVVVTPAHQFPLGVVLTPERRSALLDWAADRRAYVIEDDYDAEFRYDRAPVGSLQGRAPDRVVYLGSVSKTLVPAIRLGWLLAPGDLIRDVYAEIATTMIMTPLLEQLALAEFISRGRLDRHRRRMRLRYRRRRDLLVGCLAEELPEVAVRGVAAGLHVTAELPAGYPEAQIVRAALEHGIGLDGVGAHTSGAGRPPTLLLGYAAVPDASIRAGIRALARIVREHRTRERPASPHSAAR